MCSPAGQLGGRPRCEFPHWAPFNQRPRVDEPWDRPERYFGRVRGPCEQRLATMTARGNRSFPSNTAHRPCRQTNSARCWWASLRRPRYRDRPRTGCTPTHQRVSLPTCGEAEPPPRPLRVLRPHPPERSTRRQDGHNHQQIFVRTHDFSTADGPDQLRCRSRGVWLARGVAVLPGRHRPSNTASRNRRSGDASKPIRS